MKVTPTIHASVVLVGAHALLIRGSAGSGKSRLVLNLIQAMSNGPLMFARLVADDRVHVQAVHGRLIARPPTALAGLLEVRGLGIRQLPYEPMAVVSWVADLDAEPPMRVPEDAATRTTIDGIGLPRLAVAPGCDPFPIVLAALTCSAPSATAANSPGNAAPKRHDGPPLAVASLRATQV